LDTADEVKKEYDEHEDVINKFRNQTISGGGATSNVSSGNSASLSRSGSSDSGDFDPNDPKNKKKKKKKFMKGFSQRVMD